MNLNTYLIKFQPVAGTGPGQLYTLRRENVADAIRAAKAKHTLDFGFLNVRQEIDTVRVWDDTAREYVDITAEVEI